VSPGRDGSAAPSRSSVSACWPLRPLQGPCCRAAAPGPALTSRHAGSPLLPRWGCWGACRSERGPRAPCCCGPCVRQRRCPAAREVGWEREASAPAPGSCGFASALAWGRVSFMWSVPTPKPSGEMGCVGAPRARLASPSASSGFGTGCGV